MDDVVLNKAAAIERCIRRVREVHAGDDRNLTDDFTKQDSIILNIRRGCETAIDLAMHLMRKHRLGIPQESREAFTLLAGAGLLSEPLATRLAGMVGFRTVAVHEYQQIDLAVVSAIITKHLDDLQAFASLALVRL